MHTRIISRIGDIRQELEASADISQTETKHCAANMLQNVATYCKVLHLALVILRHVADSTCDSTSHAMFSMPSPNQQASEHEGLGEVRGGRGNTPHRDDCRAVLGMRT